MPIKVRRCFSPFDSLTLVLPQLQAGRLKALGIASRERSTLAPNLPTISSSGVPGFEVSGWYGVLAPSGTPEDIVARLGREFQAIVEDPAMRTQLAARGIEPVGQGPAALGRLLRDENEKWRRIVTQAGIRAD